MEEIGGQRCTVVEKGVDKKRVDFLKALLQHNQFEVVVDELPKTEENAEQFYTIGVTDLVFNPVIAVFEMSLKTPQGEPVTAPYWNQETTDTITEYWQFAK